MKSGYALTPDEIKIHYIDNENGNSKSFPLLIVPGMLGTADDYESGLSRFKNLRVIVFSNRGLGKSGAVSVGSTKFSDRMSDISAVVNHLGLTEYHLYGFSRGVSLAVGHALKFPEQVRSLMVHDCDAKYLKPSPQWVERVLTGRKNLSEQTIRAYAEDAEKMDLSSRLKEISCPSLVIRGGKEGSLLSEERAKEMATDLKGSKVEVLFQSAHEVSPSDFPRFVEILEDFCLRAL